jgi:hypothetical protein
MYPLALKVAHAQIRKSFFRVKYISWDTPIGRKISPEEVPAYAKRSAYAISFYENADLFIASPCVPSASP